MTFSLGFPNCRHSPLGRMDARWKLAAIFPSAVLVAFLNTSASVLAALIGSMALAGLGRLPLRWFLLRLGSVALFLGFFGFWLAFVPAPGETAIDVLGISFYRSGVERAGILVGKGLAIVSLMMAMLATAPLPATLKAAHCLRVPGLFVQLALLTYRHLFLLGEEFVRLRTALRVRGFRNRASVHSYRTIGRVAGTLLVRGHERAERVAQAMRCRGFDGTYRSLEEFRTRASDVVGFCLILGGTIAILVASLLKVV